MERDNEQQIVTPAPLLRKDSRYRFLLLARVAPQNPSLEHREVIAWYHTPLKNQSWLCSITVEVVVFLPLFLSISPAFLAEFFKARSKQS